MVQGYEVPRGGSVVSSQKKAIDRKFYLRREQNSIIMYSSEDLERFYFQYQTVCQD